MRWQLLFIAGFFALKTKKTLLRVEGNNSNNRVFPKSKNSLRSWCLLAFLLLASALFCPTSLEIMWKGYPLTDKPALLLTFISLLSGLLILSRWFEGTLKDLIYKKFFLPLSLGSTLCALTLVGMKFGSPPQNAIETCVRSPSKASEKCLTSTEKYVQKIQLGGPGHPWRFFYLNTLDFNYYTCKPADKRCQEFMRRRGEKSEPFEMTFSIPKQYWEKEKTLKADYVGMLGRRLPDEKIEWSGFSNHKQSTSFNFETTSDTVELVYRNFNCETASLSSCFSKGEIETLSTDVALLHVPVSSTSEPRRFIADALGWLSFLLLLAWTLALLFVFDVKNFTRSPSQGNLVLESNLVFVFSFFFLLSAQERGHPEVYLSVLAWCLMWNAYFKKQFRFLRTGIGALLLVWCLMAWLPASPRDMQSFYPPGDDELSYSSMAYDWLTHTDWFRHPYMVLSKPFFIYWRGIIQTLLGDGTYYLHLLMQFSTGLVPLLLCFLGAGVLEEKAKNRNNSVSLIGVVLGTSFFFLILESLRKYIFLGYSGKSETPAWFSALVGLVLLLPVIQRGRALTFPQWCIFWAFFAFSIGMRTFNITVFLILPLFLLMHSVNKKKCFLSLALILGGFCVLILAHALPVLLAKEGQESLSTYLKLQSSGWDYKKPSVWLGYDRIFFSSAVKPALLTLMTLLGVAAFNLKERVYRYVGFIGITAIFGVALYAHANITDPAGYPRHVLLFHLIVLFTLVNIFLAAPPLSFLHGLLKKLGKSETNSSN